VSDFARSATRALGALFGAWCLTMVAGGVMMLCVALVIALTAAVSGVMPAWLLIPVGILLAVLALAALIWLMVRIALWNITIVVDRLGPIAGLRTAFRATRGVWWQLVGLGGVLFLLMVGAGLVFRLLEFLAGLLGPVGVVLALVVGLAQIVANLYLGFMGVAAFIRFYEDIKSPTVAVAPTTAPLA